MHQRLQVEQGDVDTTYAPGNNLSANLVANYTEPSDPNDPYSNNEPLD